MSDSRARILADKERSTMSERSHVITHAMQPVLPEHYAVITVGDMRDETPIYFHRIKRTHAGQPGAIARNGGGVLQFGPHIYAINRTIVLPRFTVLRGAAALQRANKFERVNHKIVWAETPKIVRPG